MYTATPDLRFLLAERLTDAQTAFATDEIFRSSKNDDKRQERRFRWSEPASLYSFNPLRLRENQVQLVDVSRRGLGLFSTESLECGTQVQVHFQDFLVVGEICYCVVKAGIFRSGIRIESVLRRKRAAERSTINGPSASAARNSVLLGSARN